MTDRVLDLPMAEIAALCRRYRVQELSVFGSALRDDFRDDSDYDLLVLFHPNARSGFIEFARLQRDLADLLGRKVDLGSKRALKPAIPDEVLASARVIYAAQ